MANASKENDKKKAVPLPRAVEGYDPVAQIATVVSETGEEKRFFPLEEKKRWLHLWAEKNDRDVLLSSEVKPENSMIPGIGMIAAQATLDIEDEPVRTATAYVAIQNGQTVEYYSSLPQVAMARAESRVLVNAGFNVPVNEDETRTPATPGVATPVAANAETQKRIDTPVAPPEDIPPALANPPWEKEAKEAEAAQHAAPAAKNQPETEPEPEMTLDEAKAYEIRLEELKNKRIFAKLSKAMPDGPTVGGLLDIPVGVVSPTSDGISVLKLLGGRGIRENGSPVGEVIDPNCKLHQAIILVLDSIVQDAQASNEG